MSEVAAREGFYAALRRHDAEALYERAPCGYLSTTPDGLIVQVNSTFLTLTGYAREELVERRQFTDLLPAGDRIYHETHYAPMLRMQGEAHEIAFEILRPDGSRLPVLLNAVLEHDDLGTPVAIRAAIFDATHRREYERELLRAKQRAEESELRAVTLARTLQQTLIPPAPPEIPGLDVVAAYRPAGTGAEVGGDFYDVFQLGPQDWMAVVGDVCGKGVEAAVVTAAARHVIRAAAMRHTAPSEVLAELNDALLQQKTGRFVTVVLVRLHQHGAAWRATISCGGHPPPILLTADGEVAPIGRPGSLIGVMESVELYDVSLELLPWSGLVMYTDGVTEARCGDEFFGNERLADCVAELAGSDAAGLTRGVVERVLEFQHDDPRDDIALVCLRVPLPEQAIGTRTG